MNSEVALPTGINDEMMKRKHPHLRATQQAATGAMQLEIPQSLLTPLPLPYPRGAVQADDPSHAPSTKMKDTESHDLKKPTRKRPHAQRTVQETPPHQNQQTQRHMKHTSAQLLHGHSTQRIHHDVLRQRNTRNPPKKAMSFTAAARRTPPVRACACEPQPVHPKDRRRP